MEGECEIGAPAATWGFPYARRSPQPFTLSRSSPPLAWWIRRVRVRISVGPGPEATARR